MEIRATLLPGQNGTKQLLKKYGDQLVCVRYRYDKERRKRFKTIELVVDEQDWIPGVTIPADKLVLVRVGFGEMELRERIKAEGGFWYAEKKAWQLSYRKVLELGVERRILDKDLSF